MTTLSTHVLDTSLGRPAAGVAVSLHRRGRRARRGGHRLPTAGSADLGGAAGAGDLHLRFDSGGYFAERGIDGFYPEVLVTFTISGAGHVHVPLLLSPFGYSTYRGS